MTIPSHAFGPWATSATAAVHGPHGPHHSSSYYSPVAHRYYQPAPEGPRVVATYVSVAPDTPSSAFKRVLGVPVRDPRVAELVDGYLMAAGMDDLYSMDGGAAGGTYYGRSTAAFIFKGGALAPSPLTPHHLYIDRAPSVLRGPPLVEPRVLSQIGIRGMVPGSVVGVLKVGRDRAGRGVLQSSSRFTAHRSTASVPIAYPNASCMYIVVISLDRGGLSETGEELSAVTDTQGNIVWDSEPTNGLLSMTNMLGSTDVPRVVHTGW